MALLPNRQVNILTGASGSGKSTILCQALSAWEKKERFPFMLPPSTRSVGFIIMDRTKDEMDQRLKALGVTQVETYGFVDDTLSESLLKTPSLLFAQIIEKRLSQRHDAYVLDPVALLLEAKSTNDLKEVAAGLIRMARFAAANNACIIATHHTVKTRSDFSFVRPQDRISGSSAWQGYSGTQLVLIEGAETQSEAHTLVIVSHMSRPEEYKLVRGQDGFFYPQKERAIAVLKDMLTSPFVTKKQLNDAAAIAGIDPSDLVGTMYRPAGKGLLKLVAPTPEG